jgi:glycolate oxidase iron-sulfur subunit
MNNDSPKNKLNTCQHIDEIASVCSSCGNCLFSCPVYNAELVEPLSPRGRINIIKSIMDGNLKPTGSTQKFIYQCALCGGCENTCTKGVEFTDMMIDYRNEAAKGRKIPFIKKVILYFYQSVLFKKFSGLVDILARTPLRRKLGIPRRRKANLKKLLTRKPEQERYDILFFPGCVNTYFYPEIIGKSLSVLEKHGYSVVVPEGLVCCGFPYISQGWKEKFFKLRGTNVKRFEDFRFKYLVVPCSTGVMTFRKYYELEDEARDFEVYEMTEFFYKFIKDAEVAKGMREGGKVTWHDPCHSIKSLGIEDAPRHYMKQAGEKFMDDKSALCCGFGGIFSVGFPSTSKKILKRKNDKLDEMGSDTVVTGCPGCYMHLRENLPEGKEVKFFSDLF